MSAVVAPAEESRSIMSAITPAEERRSPPSSGDVAVAWSRKRPPNPVLLRVMEIFGWILGHGPGRFGTTEDRSAFTYKNFRTLHALMILILITIFQIYSFVKPRPQVISGSWIEVMPYYVDVILFYFTVAFNISQAEAIKVSFSDIYKVTQSVTSLPHVKQVLSLVLWCLYVAIAISRAVILTIQDIQKTEFTFGVFIMPFVDIFIKIYMTWLLEMYILICLTLSERQRQLKKLMKEVITPQREEFWNLLDVQVIEGAINQHRSFSKQAIRFFEMMSPALMVLLASFFINNAFGLHVFLTKMVFVDGILKPLALLEIGYLLSYFGLVFIVCYVTSTLSDEWCGVGQEVTGVPLCRVTDKIRVQLLTFLQQLPDQAPVVTAAGFFVISKSTLLTMMNFITTYLFFIVQFHES